MSEILKPKLIKTNVPKDPRLLSGTVRILTVAPNLEAFLLSASLAVSK